MASFIRMKLLFFTKQIISKSSYQINCKFSNCSSLLTKSQLNQTFKVIHNDKSNYQQIRFESIKAPKPPKKERPIFTWKTLIVSGGLIVLVTIAFLHFKKEKMLKLEQERRRSLGKAAIGGKFELIDHNGKKCSSDDFLGKWVILYFGFTHCPDICPDEIEKMVKAVDIIESSKKNDPIQSLFITVDPERDSVEAVAGYIKEFSPKLIGLTGSKEQIDATSKSFRVYYSAGPRDQQNDYIVDHTIIMYLINPEGEFVDYYGQNRTAEEIANGIQLSMMKYKKLKSKSFF